MRRGGVLGVCSVIVALSGLTGCAAALVGAGVAGGYALGKDSVTDHFDRSVDQLFDRALAVAQQRGTVNTQDRAAGRITATIEGADVTITVRPVTKKTVKLVVKARDHLLMPKVSVAQDVHRQISEGL